MLRHVAVAALAMSVLPVVTKRASGLPSSQSTTTAGRVTRRDPAKDSIKLTRRVRRWQIRRVSNTWSDSAVLGSFPHQNFTDCDRGQREREVWRERHRWMRIAVGFRRGEEESGGGLKRILRERRHWHLSKIRRWKGKVRVDRGPVSTWLLQVVSAFRSLNTHEVTTLEQPGSGLSQTTSRVVSKSANHISYWCGKRIWSLFKLGLFTTLTSGMWLEVHAHTGDNNKNKIIQFFITDVWCSRPTITNTKVKCPG